jgi:hypothetical protein
MCIFSQLKKELLFSVLVHICTTDRSCLERQEIQCQVTWPFGQLLNSHDCCDHTSPADTERKREHLTPALMSHATSEQTFALPSSEIYSTFSMLIFGHIVLITFQWCISACVLLAKL